MIALEKTIKATMGYVENNYLRNPRIINNEYRARLQSFQVPAIKKHFGHLEGKCFADIGCGDIPLGYCQEEMGRPKKYYATDLNRKALASGLKSMKKSGIDISNMEIISGPYFDFDLIPNASIDAAFSNSLFSHLSLNTILICLKRLRPKMANHAKYLSSMIILPPGIDCIEYKWEVKHGATSHAAKDPFHYRFSEFKKVVDSCTDFTCHNSYEYGHPFQALVEFLPKS